MSLGMFTPEEIRASMRLYAVTDRSWLQVRSLRECVEQAIKGGATCVQLREKQAESGEKQALARELKDLCAEKQIPFLINDDIELALLVNADGVHVGQTDTDCARARSILGAEAIIGVSVQTLDEALEAETAGADYLGVGAMFGTPTKPEAAEVTIEVLRAICRHVHIPVVAIGGLNLDTIPELADSGVDGVAVVSALFASDDIRSEAARLLSLAHKL